ncbi:MAG: hypothetical protein RL077_4198 [Verrucomicrobiota bacterium]|jgi:hypothetical protein
MNEPVVVAVALFRSFHRGRDGDSGRAPAFAGAAPEECAETIVLARWSQATVYPLLNFI